MAKSDSIINQSSEILQNLRNQRLFQIIVTIEVVLSIITVQRMIIGRWDEVYSILIAMLLFSSVFYFLRIGKYKVGTNVLITFATLIITFFMWNFNGLHDEVILFYPVVLIFAVILGSEKFLVAILLFTVTNIFLNAYVNVNGIYTNEPLSVTMSTAILISIIIGLSTFSIWLLSSTLRKALITEN